MQITDVRVRKITKEGKMKAIVSITLDDEFVVHDIKVIEGEKGLFIAMPSKKAMDGEYRDIAHPINSSTRDSIQKIILDAYDKATEFVTKVNKLPGINSVDMTDAESIEALQKTYEEMNEYEKSFVASDVVSVLNAYVAKLNEVKAAAGDDSE